MVAGLIAAQQGTAAIEMYIMLQFMLGSFITTLSTLGVRLWLMSPDRLAKLETTTTTGFKSFSSATKARLGRLFKMALRKILKKRCPDLWGQEEKIITRKEFMLSTSIIALLAQYFHLFKTSLDVLSTLKPPGLSWSGVIWRISIAAVVAAYNLTFWFDHSGSGAHSSRPDKDVALPTYSSFLSSS
ncbi:hypothetical protein N7465_000127 [Penicillium sp. CMV-2018d]|nr:hypothetical protein N7465_000127 [Penicillium sp. CMV-2018d]